MFNSTATCGKNVFNPWNGRGKCGGVRSGKLNQLFSIPSFVWKTSTFPRFVARFVHHVAHMNIGDTTDYREGFSTFYTGPINTNVRI